MTAWTYQFDSRDARWLSVRSGGAIGAVRQGAGSAGRDDAARWTVRMPRSRLSNGGRKDPRHASGRPNGEIRYPTHHSRAGTSPRLVSWQLAPDAFSWHKSISREVTSSQVELWHRTHRLNYGEPSKGASRLTASLTFAARLSRMRNAICLGKTSSESERWTERSQKRNTGERISEKKDRIAASKTGRLAKLSQKIHEPITQTSE